MIQLRAVITINTALLPCDGRGLIVSDDGRRSFVTGLVPLGRVQWYLYIIFLIVSSSCSWPGSSLRSAAIRRLTLFLAAGEDIRPLLLPSFPLPSQSFFCFPVHSLLLLYSFSFTIIPLPSQSFLCFPSLLVRKKPSGMELADCPAVFLRFVYDSVADVPESWVWLRADFQSGSRVLEKVFWNFPIYIYGTQCDFMPKSCWKHSNFENR